MGGPSQSACESCTACAECAYCASQAADCILDCDCANVQTCAAGCTDQACVTQCEANGAGQGGSEYQALAACLACACPNSCATPAGTCP